MRTHRAYGVHDGYRQRRWDTRAGTIDLAIPKLRAGSYFPEWLLERRRRAAALEATMYPTISSFHTSDVVIAEGLV